MTAKRKDDRLVMSNGDRFVGEVKKLEHGQLRFKPDYVVDSFEVDWIRVSEVESQDSFQVVLNDGRHLTGLIARSANGSFVITEEGGNRTSLLWSDIVGFLPVETNIWRQLTGNINSGFSYSSDDNQTQLSISGAIGYAADRWATNLSGSSTSSAQSSSSGTSRNIADVTSQITLAPRWFAAGLVELLNSHQQDLDLRTTAGAGVGRWLIQTDRTGLALLGGMVYTHEQYAATTDDGQPPTATNNVEGLLLTRFSLYRFKTTDVEANLAVYPSFSAFGRVRLSLSPTLNLEIAHNLYWSFTLYENYDSQPPVNANKNDFGITNSISWKF